MLTFSITKGRDRGGNMISMDFEGDKFVKVEPKAETEFLIINFEPEAAIKKLQSFDYSKNNYSKEK